MQRRLQLSLRMRYPELFNAAGNDLPINRWGIEVGDGWYRIIDAVLDAAHIRCADIGCELTVTDCKQKLGTLRIRFRGEVDDYLRGVIDAALALSACTCECCGGPGAFRARRAVIRCDACAKMA